MYVHVVVNDGKIIGGFASEAAARKSANAGEDIVKVYIEGLSDSFQGLGANAFIPRGRG